MTQSPEFQDPIRYKEFRFVPSSKRKDTKDQITKEGREEQVLPVLAPFCPHTHLTLSFLFLIGVENASDCTLWQSVLLGITLANLKDGNENLKCFSRSLLQHMVTHDIVPQ